MTALGAERLVEVAEAALAVEGADDAEALVYRQAGGLTRFASSRIHQSAWREDLWVRVRVVVDGNRVGTATVHAADPEAVRATARRAVARTAAGSAACTVAVPTRLPSTTTRTRTHRSSRQADWWMRLEANRVRPPACR